MELSDALKEVPGINYDVSTAIQENKGFAVIMAGSDSDKPHIDALVKALNGYGIKSQVRIASAHKEPEVVASLVGLYDSFKSPIVYVAVAGKTDALSGMVSFLSVNPVVSCPPDHPNTSCLNNPPGSSNAYVGDPKNLARYVAQIFSHLNPEVRRKLESERDGKIIKLIGKDKELSKYPYAVEG